MNKLKIKEYDGITSFFECLKSENNIDKNVINFLLGTNQIQRANRFFILNHEELGTIGCIILTDNRIDSLYIESLLIRCEFQKLGFGKAVVNTFIDIYREKGYKNIKLESELSSQGFWKKQGFTGNIKNMTLVL